MPGEQERQACLSALGRTAAAEGESSWSGLDPVFPPRNNLGMHRCHGFGHRAAAMRASPRPPALPLSAVRQLPLLLSQTAFIAGAGTVLGGSVGSTARADRRAQPGASAGRSGHPWAAGDAARGAGGDLGSGAGDRNRGGPRCRSLRAGPAFGGRARQALCRVLRERAAGAGERPGGDRRVGWRSHATRSCRWPRARWRSTHCSGWNGICAPRPWWG